MKKVIVPILLGVTTISFLGCRRSNLESENTLVASEVITSTEHSTLQNIDSNVFESNGITVFGLTPSKTGVEEFLVNYPNIKSSDKDDELFNVTPHEITDKFNFRIFKYSTNCESYLEYNGKNYHIGTGFGGFGTVSFAVADIDANGSQELYFTYSSGSGVHASGISYFDFATETVTDLEYKYIKELTERVNDCIQRDMVLTVNNDTLEIYSAIIEGISFTELKPQLKDKLGEITSDSGKIKIVGQSDNDTSILYDFSVQYVRTNGYVEGKTYPQVMMIDNRPKLEEYVSSNNDIYPEYKADLVDAIEKYDIEWFKSNKLLMVILEEPSGSIQHTVTKLTDSYVVINNIPGDTDDMAEWHIFIEVDKNYYFIDTEDFEVKFVGYNPYN